MSERIVQHSKIVTDQIKRFPEVYLKQSNFPQGRVCFSSWLDKSKIDGEHTVAIFKVKRKDQ